MDISSIIGLVICLVAIALGVGNRIGDIIHPQSFFITVLGSIGSTFIAHPKKRSFKLINIFLEALKDQKIDNGKILDQLYTFAEKARRDGMIALEDDINSIEDTFLKDGLRAAVDGTDPEEINKILEIKIDLYEQDREESISVMDTWGAMAPAFGMIGTLIGLVLLLKTLNDPTTLGPSMSVALITTLYGAFIANIFALPAAEKLKGRMANVVNQKRMIMEGILSIVNGENPRVMEEKLKAFLNTDEKKLYEESKGEQKI